MSDIKRIAQDYITAGWQVVPLVKDAKRASTSWRTKVYSSANFRADDGIALKCGEPSGCPRRRRTARNGKFGSCLHSRRFSTGARVDLMATTCRLTPMSSATRPATRCTGVVYAPSGSTPARAPR